LLWPVALAFSLLFFWGCDKEEPIPGYLYIPSITVSTNSNGTQGSNASEIVDAWVYVNGKFIGVFELPSRIPILETGKNDVLILAGIKKNGLSTERVTYPFYEQFEQKVDFGPGKIDTLKPVVKYRSICTFPWLEDFEDQRISLEGSGSFTTIDSMYITNDPFEVYGFDAIKNKYSGKIQMDTGLQFFENSSIQLFALPRSGQEIYLEFNYKTDVELSAGFYPITSSFVTGVSIVRLFPTNGVWKKAYVSLKEDVNSPQYAGAEFRMVFNAQSNNATVVPEIFFDNIKLIHF
jgi:hypothetical protein